MLVKQRPTAAFQVSGFKAKQSAVKFGLGRFLKRSLYRILPFSGFALNHLSRTPPPDSFVPCIYEVEFIRAPIIVT